MTDISQSEAERLSEGNSPSGVEDYDEVLTPLAKEVVRRRPLHQAIRSELEQLERFVGYKLARANHPVTVEAIERIIAAWRAAEAQ